MEDPPSMSIGLGLMLVVVLVLFNAFFVAAEFALVGARDTRLQEMSNRGNRRARIAQRAIKSLDRYISATQLGITLASLGLGWIGEPALAGLIEEMFTWLPPSAAAIATHTVAVGIAFSIITALHIILGELVPKALALLYPEQVSGWTAGPLIGFAWVMHLPILVLNGTANWLLRLFGVNPPPEDRLHSPEEIRMLVVESREGGQIKQDDATLLTGVFRFSEKTAEEVMTPRTQMMAIEGGQTLMEASDEMARSARSRYPVYTGSVDEIVGTIHTKDLLKALRVNPNQPVKAIMRDPMFVPGTREIEDVLADMRRRKIHLAVVLDEYGGTAGLVTMEDLLEEIVGEIFDEHDTVVPPETRQPQGEGTMLDGGLPISEFNEEFNTQLDDADYTTLGGYIFGLLGRLPRPGDRMTVDGKVFEVVEMDGRRVSVIRMAEAEPAEQAES